MRIIAGENRGVVLADVGAGDAAAHLRPTPDRVREAVFSMLMSGKYNLQMANARVLDMFAGTGALGFEALSRGAMHCTFVDDGAVAQRLIKENAKRLKRTTQARVIAGQAARMTQAKEACKLIFLDPPYAQNLGVGALVQAEAQGWIAPNALVVWEENAPQAPPTKFALLEHRRFGDTWITLLRFEG